MSDALITGFQTRTGGWLAEHGRTIVFGLTIAAMPLWILYILSNPIAIDAHAYFTADPAHLYGAPVGGVDAYLYSPAFAQVLTPLRSLGWDGFRSVWRAIELGSLVAVAGPLTGPALFVPPIAYQINLGNIDLLLGLAIILGFRWPATWSLVLLTKVTPGVGLLWFAARREWRKLGIALGATAAVVLVSLPFGPGLWVDWIRTISGAQSPGSTVEVIALPLIVRLVIAAAIVVVGARLDQPWAVVVAGFVALPVTWWPSLSMLAAVPAAILISQRNAPPLVPAQVASADRLRRA